MQEKIIDDTILNHRNLLIAAAGIIIVLLVAVIFLLYSRPGLQTTGFSGQQIPPIVNNPQTKQTAATQQQAAQPVPFVSTDLSNGIKKQSVTPLAVIQQISGGKITAKVQLISQSGLPSSSKQATLGTYVKTVDIAVNGGTKFNGLSSGDLKIGGAYTIVVDKPFVDGGSLTALVISPSNMTADRLSAPAVLAPPVFSK